MEQMYKHTDLFLTHTWRTDLHGHDNHARVRIVNQQLNRLGYLTWFDEKSMSGDIKAKMAEGVDFTKCVLVFVTEEYMKKIDAGCDDNCKFEYDRALAQKTEKNILCIVMEEEYQDPSKWFGKLQHTLGNCLFVSMAGDLNNKKYLNQQVQLVVDQLKSKGVLPSQTKNMCEDCTITNKNGKQQPLFCDGNACTYCGENLKSTGEPNNYCVTCHIHSNGSYCHSCKMHLLDKNQRIEELKEQLLELISLESNVDLINYDVNSFQDTINKMKNNLHLLETRRREAQFNGLKLHINKKDYDYKLIEFQNEIEDLVNSTSTLDETKDKCNSLVPSFEEELKQFGKYMRTLDESRKEYLQHAEFFSKTMKKLEQVEKQVSEFANTAVEGDKHVHDKSCSCEECVFERELTSELISNAGQYLESLVATNEIEKLKTAIVLKREIKELKGDKELNLLLSLTVEYGTVEMLQMLLEGGVYIDCEQLKTLIEVGSENNLFTQIITDNKVEDLQSLIEIQKDIVAAKSKHGFNLLLYLTMQHGTVDLFIMLLEMGARVDIEKMGSLVKAVGENNLLRNAITDNKVADLRSLIESLKDILEAKDERGFNLLLSLTMKDGTVDMFIMLLEMGARVDIEKMGSLVKAFGENNLFRKVITKNKVENLHSLVESQKDIMEAKDGSGFNLLLSLTMQYGTVDMLVMLLDMGAKVDTDEMRKLLETSGISLLRKVISNNDGAGLRKIIELEKDIINAKGENGFNLFLLLTVQYGTLELFNMLVEMVCEEDIVSTRNGTLLHHVKNTDIAEKLCVKHGDALLSVKDEYGCTPFMTAYLKNYVTMVETISPFVRVDEEIKEKNNCLTLLFEKKGVDYIMSLISNNNIPTMAALLTLNQDVIKMAEYSINTPFLWCCRSGSTEMLKLLVDSGSNVNKCDNRGNTALMRVVQFNTTEWCEEVVEYLCTTQPHQLTMENNDGCSVFYHAAYKKRKSLVPILLKHSPTPQLLEKKNRWGDTPIDEAKKAKKRKGHETILQMYENYIKDNKANATTETK